MAHQQVPTSGLNRNCIVHDHKELVTTPVVHLGTPYWVRPARFTRPKPKTSASSLMLPALSKPAPALEGDQFEGADFPEGKAAPGSEPPTKAAWDQQERKPSTGGKGWSLHPQIVQKVQVPSIAEYCRPEHPCMTTAA